MAGRPRKPADLHIINGNPGHKTKADLEAHKSAEVQLGTPDLKMPSEVRNDAVARKKWNELKKLYDGFDLISSSDVGAISQLCLAYSEIAQLRDCLNNLMSIKFDPAECSDAMREFEEQRGERGAQNLWDKIEYILSAQGALAFHGAINAKRNVIRSLEDRLFLNPLAKIRNVPKKKEEEKSTSGFDKLKFNKIGNK